MAPDDLIKVADEGQKIAEATSNGHFWPLTIVTLVFAALFAALFYIWNITLKNNKERHEGHDKRFDGFDTKFTNQDTINTQQVQLFNELKLMNSIQNVKIERNEKDIAKIESQS